MNPHYLLGVIHGACGGWYEEDMYFRLRVHSKPLPGKLLWALGCLPVALARRAMVAVTRRLEFTQVELPITTRCTLRCKDCANLIPFYEAPAHVEAETLFADVDAFLSLVDRVHSLRVMGGEAFWHPDLPRILARLLESDKIGLLHVITNGTLLPGSELLQVLSHRRLVVDVSAYSSEVAENQLLLLAKLQEHGINFTHDQGQRWSDFGGFAPAVDCSAAALAARFKRCYIKRYHTLIGGEFHLCPRSAHGSRIGQFTAEASDAVRFRFRTDRSLARAEFRRLLRKPYVAACTKCTGGAGVLAPAIQIPASTGAAPVRGGRAGARAAHSPGD